MLGGRYRRDLMAKPDDPYELALKALGRREHTAFELAEWLRRRGVGEAGLSEALERLCDEGALDDGRFARAYAEDKRELRSWGPDRISAELRRRGLEVSFVGGRRVTSAAALEVVRASLVEVNEHVCAAIGPAAVGKRTVRFSTSRRALIRARPACGGRAHRAGRRPEGSGPAR